MKVLKTTLSMAVIGMLIAAPAFAQAAAAPRTPPPAGQKPAAPAAGQPPAPQAPKPFPEGAKVGYIDIQLIASSSVEGKSASGKIQEWEKKVTAELAEKNKQAQALQTKLQQGGNVLSDSARAQSEKDLQKLQRDLQGLQEDAQRDRGELTAQLQGEFQEKLNPIIEQIATEKNLLMVFSVRDSGVVWAYNGVDLSAEVIRRFDAATKAAPKK
ncbi:MAG TPA: OmpH family outer membrane protein [Vicinamibacterales bacterium]|nr:OmpH family outer membrane protein [Vicinamibacterales bacterium]